MLFIIILLEPQFSSEYLFLVCLGVVKIQPFCILHMILMLENLFQAITI